MRLQNVVELAATNLPEEAVQVAWELAALYSYAEVDSLHKGHVRFLRRELLARGWPPLSSVNNSKKV